MAERRDRMSDPLGCGTLLLLGLTALTGWALLSDYMDRNRLDLTGAGNTAPLAGDADEPIGRNLTEGQSNLMTREWPAQIEQWRYLAEKYAPGRNLDPELILAIISFENPNGIEDLVTIDGCVGLMGNVSSDGGSGDEMCINGPCFADRPTTEEFQQAELNIEWGVDHLADLVEFFDGDIKEALNARGPENWTNEQGETYADVILRIWNSHVNP